MIYLFDFNSFFLIDFSDIQIQLSSLSDILENIKANANNTTTSSVSPKSTVRYLLF
jgi:hypothetical protein